MSLRPAVVAVESTWARCCTKSRKMRGEGRLRTGCKRVVGVVAGGTANRSTGNNAGHRVEAVVVVDTVRAEDVRRAVVVVVGLFQCWI